MQGKAIGRCVLAAILIGGPPIPAPGADIPEAMTVRLIRPDRQLERLIDLFKGSRATDPAAALAAWKRSAGAPKGLGKPVEAAIALLNPAMVRELRTLDGAVLGIEFDPNDGNVRWNVVVPHDDGTFAALATALVLTEGASDLPLEGHPVDRLGPPGAPLLASMGGAVALAGTRDDLAVAVAKARAGGLDRPNAESGWFIRFDPSAMTATGPVARRRAAEALQGIGCREAEGAAGLSGDSLSFAISATLDPAPAPSLSVDPGWLDWVPDRSSAAVAIALDPRPEAWDRTFALADRVERADPARAGLAPLRTRLNLIATAAGVRLETDLWPRLVGVSACLLPDAAGQVEGALIALHAHDPEAAERISGQIVPRLAARLPQGRLAGRPIAVLRRESTVLVAWGDSTLSDCLKAKDQPDHPAGAAIRAPWGPIAPPRAGAFWPGRLRATAPAGSPLAQTLAEAPPVVWWGRNDGPVARDFVRWTDLDGLIRRFLERIPLDPQAPKSLK
jgi:hypothetical protein